LHLARIGPAVAVAILSDSRFAKASIVAIENSVAITVTPRQGLKPAARFVILARKSSAASVMRPSLLRSISRNPHRTRSSQCHRLLRRPLDQVIVLPLALLERQVRLSGVGSQ